MCDSPLCQHSSVCLMHLKFVQCRAFWSMLQCCCSRGPSKVVTLRCMQLLCPLACCAWYAQSHVLLTGARSSVHCATSQHITEEKSPSQCYINFTCKPVKPKARFVDSASGKWLWQWSAETTGLPAEVDLPEQPNGSA